MATHSSILAWRIPGTGEPGGLPSMGSHRVGHNWSDLAAAVAATVLKVLVAQPCLTPCNCMDYSTGLLCPWDSPGKNIGVGCHVLLQGNLPNPGIELGSPALQANSLLSEPPSQGYPLEEGMTPHPSILAWRIPGVEKPGELQSIGSQRVRHYWSELACTHAVTLITVLRGWSWCIELRTYRLWLFNEGAQATHMGWLVTPSASKLPLWGSVIT